MTTTGYTDVFGRTVANGLGTATSGQAYVLTGAASQFSVAPGVASITSSALGNNYGLVDAGGSPFADVSGQVSLSAIPATNLAAVGFVMVGKTGGNNYTGAMMVATGGAVSLRFTRIFGGATVTLSTVATGITYVANTVYNLRFQAYWSRSLQSNVLSAKIWAVGATEPGGWLATFQDNYFTDYTAGTQVGLYARDESTALGTVARFRSVSSASYHLPVPDVADPMCADPAVTYPKQTALESLADATDTVMDGLADLTNLALAFPRVRVSRRGPSFANQFFVLLAFDTAEFNVGTPTNLGYDSQNLQLPAGIWMVTFEAQFSGLSLNSVVWAFSGPSSSQNRVYSRPWASQSGDNSVYGTVHMSALMVATDPVTPGKVSVSMNPTNTATTISVQYMALSAVKISDYFV